AGARQRRRRLHPDPGVLLRPVWSQADAGAQPPRPRSWRPRGLEPRCGACSHALGARQRRLAGRHRRSAAGQPGRALLGALALQRLQQGALDVARFFLQHDLWLTPTLAEPPPPLGTFDAPPDDPLRPFERGLAFVPFTPIGNVTGQPAMSMPLSWNEAGLPV